MPAAYEAIKAQYEKKGNSIKESKTIAAKIYNHLRSMHPTMQKLSNKKNEK